MTLRNTKKLKINKIVSIAGISGVKKPYKHNLNKVFEKPYKPKMSKSLLFIPRQLTSYADSLNSTTKIYNHIPRVYIDNLYTITTFLNTRPIEDVLRMDNQMGYITCKLQGNNKLIALLNTNPNLVTTCFNYGLLYSVYTSKGDELSKITELYKYFLTYKKITKAELYFVRVYSASAKILYEKIKPQLM